MEGNGSSCVLFSACVNCTRDGKNHENELREEKWPSWSKC
jgi:hypothetical protein